jgi:hypothetical protein
LEAKRGEWLEVEGMMGTNEVAIVVVVGTEQG